MIAFSGDALTCWFDEEGPAGPAGTLAAAMASADSMQARVRALPPIDTGDSEPRPLAIKVAIDAGSARRFLVGDPAIQTVEVLAGTVLLGVAAGEQLAGAGEVLVAQAALTRDGLELYAHETRRSEATGAWSGRPSGPGFMNT